MNFTGHWMSHSNLTRIASRTPSATTREVNSNEDTLLLSGQCLATDSQLAQAGEVGSTNGWPGCYSTVLCTRSGVTLRTDPVGQFPLFVAEEAGDVWFGTHSSTIAKHIGAPLDQVSLSATLICPEAGELTGSMYRGIRRIPPGRVVSISPSGIWEREHCTLLPASETAFSEAAEKLRLSLSAAVRARATSPDRMTSDFSGGLDSTSLALIAGEHIDGELPLLTYLNPSAPVTDDVEHARHHVQLAAGVRQHLVRAGPEHLPYQFLGPVGEVPHGSLVAGGTLRARLACAAELGSRLHLVGEGGDVVIGAPPAYLADLARRGDLRRLWRDCVLWARLRGSSPLTLFRRAIRLSGTTRRKALRLLATTVEAGHPAEEDSWERTAISYWPPPHAQWLTRSARRSLAEHVRNTADQLPSEQTLGIGDMVTADRIRQQALTLSTLRAVGAEFDIDVHAPFMDTDVVKACLSLPAYRRADPTTPKPLLRAALAGLVPRAVLARTTKGDYTRDAYLGVRRAAPALRRMLSESVAADYGILEPGPVLDVLEGAVQGLPTPWGALNQVFAVEAWLRRHEEGGSP